MDKEYLIKKWLNSELTDAEKEAFEQLDDYRLHTNIIDVAQHFKASNFIESQDFKSFKMRYESQKIKVKKLNWFKPILQIAAVLCIGFGAYFYALNNTVTSFKTLANQKTSLELPDDSKVTLNALSQITFKKENWQKNRHVKLDGEAYFIVKQGSKFNVITQDGVVAVVGTEFNVNQRHNYFEVTCFEGEVRVSSNEIKRTLHAGDTFQILNGIFIEDKTTFVEPQWINEVSSFNNVPFLIVVEEFERQYNVKVILKTIDLTRKFSGGFNHSNMKEALMSITKPMGLTFKVNSPNDVVIHENTN